MVGQPLLICSRQRWLEWPSPSWPMLTMLATSYHTRLSSTSFRCGASFSTLTPAMLCCGSCSAVSYAVKSLRCDSSLKHGISGMYETNTATWVKTSISTCSGTCRLTHSAVVHMSTCCMLRFSLLISLVVNCSVSHSVRQPTSHSLCHSVSETVHVYALGH